MQGPNTINACPRCAHDNSADVRLCTNCGLLLDGLCPACGSQNDHSSRFCGNCRHDFTVQAPDEPHQPVASDLRAEGRSFDVEFERRSSIPPGIDCPRCMHTNEPGAPYCENCGLIFAGVAGDPARPRRTIAGFAMGSLWQRLGGFVVDGIIIFAIFTVMSPITINESFGDVREGFETGQQSRRAAVLDSILSVGYETLLIGALATTIGKRAFGLSVIRADGRRVTFKRSFVRATTKAAMFGLFPLWLSLALIVANISMVAARADKRAIHDLIAGTAVVRT